MRDFLGRACMCPSLESEDGVVRYQLLTGRPGGPALGLPVVLGICTIQTTSDWRETGGVFAIELQRPD